MLPTLWNVHPTQTACNVYEKKHEHEVKPKQRQAKPRTSHRHNIGRDYKVAPTTSRYEGQHGLR